MIYTKEELINWAQELHNDLMACDPSTSVEAMDQFFDIQEEQECFAAACTKAGYEVDQILDESY